RTSRGRGATLGLARPPTARRRGREDRAAEAAHARGGGAPPRPPACRGGGGLLRALDGLPRRDRLPRADQLLHHLVPVVHLARARLGDRPLLALDGRLRLA